MINMVRYDIHMPNFAYIVFVEDPIIFYQYTTSPFDKNIRINPIQTVSNNDLHTYIHSHTLIFLY